MIFPRYHQGHAVLRLEAAATKEGPGHSYLVQHSAGLTSGRWSASAAPPSGPATHGDPRSGKVPAPAKVRELAPGMHGTSRSYQRLVDLAASLS